MLKQLFELPDQFVVNIRLFRVIGIMILATLLISKFPWINGLLARVLDTPDIRHNITVSYDSTNNQNIADIVVVNLGQVKADNVLIHFRIISGYLATYLVESQELYEERQIDLQNGAINIWLQRIAPGASVHLKVAGVFDVQNINFSATSDQGASISSELPSFSSQVNTYSSSMMGIYEKTMTVIRNRAPSFQNKLAQWSQSIIGFSTLIELIKSDDFRTILSAVVLLSLFIALFLPKVVWLIPFLAASGMFVIGNFEIKASIVMIFTAILLLPK